MRFPLFIALIFPAISCLALTAACSSGSSDSSGDTTDANAGPDVSIDVVDAAPVYPAFPVDMPTVASLGGPTITSANIVALFDPTDPNKAAIMTFLNGFRTSNFWSDTTSEYGIGPIASVTELDLPTSMAASVAEADLSNMVAAAVVQTDFPDAGPVADNDAGDAGVPRTDRIFVIFTPPTTTISDAPCSVELGYHASLHVEGNVHVPYAVAQGACTDTQAASTPLGVEIQALGHELVEAATDPFLVYDPAYLRVDDDHLAWYTAGNANVELNDLCDEPVKVDFGGASYELANVWSDKAAAAGTFPCVPSPYANVPFLTAVAVLPNEVPYSPGFKTKGITLGVGKSMTVDVQVSSTGPMPNPFEIAAVDVASTFYKQPAQMTLSLDKTTAQNGDVLHLTITRTALSTATSLGKGAVFAIRPTSTDPATWFPSYGFVADP